MTNHDTRSAIVNTVAEFTRHYIQGLLWQAGQLAPGADQNEPLQAALVALHADPVNGLFYTMEGQEWLTLALYGAGIVDGDPAEMREIAQSLAEWMFVRPGMPNHYSIPDEWAKSDIGALWWAAVIRTEGDELITLTEAAKLANVTVQAISQRIERGTLRAFVDPFAPERQGRQKVRRSDVAQREE